MPATRAPPYNPRAERIQRSRARFCNFSARRDATRPSRSPWSPMGSLKRQPGTLRCQQKPAQAQNRVPVRKQRNQAVFPVLSRLFTLETYPDDRWMRLGRSVVRLRLRNRFREVPIRKQWTVPCFRRRYAAPLFPQHGIYFRPIAPGYYRHPNCI